MKRFFILLNILFLSTGLLYSSSQPARKGPPGSEVAGKQAKQGAAQPSGKKSALPNTASTEEFEDDTDYGPVMKLANEGDLGTAYATTKLPDQTDKQHPERDAFKAGAAQHVATILRIANPESVTTAHTDGTFVMSVIEDGSMPSAFANPQSEFGPSLTKAIRHELTALAEMRKQQIAQREAQLKEDRAATQAQLSHIQKLLLAAKDPDAQGKIPQADLEEFATTLQGMQTTTDDHTRLVTLEGNAFNNACRWGRAAAVTHLPVRGYRDATSKTDVRSISPKAPVRPTNTDE